MRKRVILFISFIIITSVGFSSNSVATDTDEHRTSPCDQSEDAAIEWEKSLESLNFEKDPDGYLDTVISLANAYQEMGYHYRALNLLNRTLPILEKHTDSYRKALFFNSLGDIYLCLGDPENAGTYFLKGLEQARLSENPRVQIMILNNLGNGFAADENYPAALTFYEKAMRMVEKSEQGNADLKSKILLNMARLGFQMGSYSEVADTLDSVMLQIAEMPDSIQKAYDLIALSRLIEKFQKKLEKNPLPLENKDKTVPKEKDEGISDPEYLNNVAFLALKEAGHIGEEMKNDRIISYSFGYTGQLYERESRYPEAIKLTRQAIFAAQQKDSGEILYLWQWQMGRIFKSMGDTENAMKSYQDAISTLNPIRQILFKGFRSREDKFDEVVKPVYLGLADLLLKQAEAAQNEESRQSILAQARDTMEILKSAELEDFFADECITAGAHEQISGQTPPHTVVLYPIMLPDRLALLMILPGGMKQISVSAGSDQIRTTVIQYRQRLQTRPNNRFMYDSRQLYNWVIRPIESVLSQNEIHTIIVAPDGALRLIPFSTLNDGERFLIEKYAIGTIPALSLTDASKGDIKLSDTLIAGLSESKHGFPPLPGVEDELRNIKQTTGSKTMLLNETYTIDNITREFKVNSFSIMHIATHGIFGGTPEESYILAYDDKLTMNRLEELIGIGRFRKQKVELLTLSACQTALGNERAAMGLAGVAVKAGVKSTVATLWYVDDEAASLAIGEFYKELGKPGISKTTAMQNVQKKMIAMRRYQHPLYWGPFLVIGNWM